jgi:hypothetical protein
LKEMRRSVNSDRFVTDSVGLRQQHRYPADFPGLL